MLYFIEGYGALWVPVPNPHSVGVTAFRLKLKACPTPHHSS